MGNWVFARVSPFASLLTHARAVLPAQFCFGYLCAAMCRCCGVCEEVVRRFTTVSLLCNVTEDMQHEGVCWKPLNCTNLCCLYSNDICVSDASGLSPFVGLSCHVLPPPPLLSLSLSPSLPPPIRKTLSLSPCPPSLPEAGMRYYYRRRAFQQMLKRYP
jgi:hypothetical protein